MYFTTYSYSADSMDHAYLGPLVHAVSICFGNLISVVASQNKFLGSPGVYTGNTNIRLFRGAHT